MIPEELSRLCGLSCMAVHQAHHIWEGEIDRSSGPVELSWSDGSFISLDARGDWTLRIDIGPWQNYYRNATPEQVKVLAKEVGLWVLEDMSQQSSIPLILGKVLLQIEEVIDETNEFIGLLFHFRGVSLRTAVWAGEIVFKVEENS